MPHGRYGIAFLLKLSLSRMARRRAQQAVSRPVSGKSPAGPPWIRPVVLALAGLLLLGWFSSASSDSDTWWTLKTGQYIAQHRSLAVPDPFSFTTYMGTASLPHEATMRDYNLKFEWLAELLLYLLYAAAGFPGVVLLRALALSLLAATSGTIVYHRSRSLYRALAATLVTAFLSGVFTSDRAYQFTNLFLAATLLILEFRRGLWLLPPIFLIWANCHGGYILGFVVLVAHVAESLLLRKQDRRLWLIAALCFLISGINPNGFRGLTILTAYRESAMIRTLFEWQKVPWWPPTFVTLLLADALGMLIWRRARTRIVDWILLVAFGAAYYTAVRNTPLAGLIAPVVIFSYLPWKRVVAAAAEWAAAAVLLAALTAELAHGNAFQFHETAWKYPSGAADFLLAHHVTAPMFNSWEKGGYLMWRLWPQERVFIDGRTLNESVFRDYQRMIQDSPAAGGPSGRDLLDRYGIQVIALNGFEANSGEPYMLPVMLSNPAQSEWKLVYQDGQATVFMRDPPNGVQALAPQTVLTSLESQCEVILADDPERPRCARGLGRLFARMGDLPRARRWMGTYLERRKDSNPADDRLYQQLSAAK